MTEKNILLLTIDCFRYDRCGFNGHHRPTTPTLDRLAGDAYVFDEAFSTGPQTVESFPGMIAGLLSHECARVSDSVNWKAIPPDTETVATFLQSAGYETAALLNNPFLTTHQNYHLGFDHFVNLKEGDVEHQGTDGGRGWGWFSRLTSIVESRLRDSDSIYNPYMLLYVAYQYRRFVEGWPGIHADAVVDGFVEQIKSLEPPFFGWTHFMDLHLPIHPAIPNRGGFQKTSYFRHFLAEGARAGDIDDARFNQIYDSALAFIDSQIDRLLTHLADENILDDTVIVITGDHGEALNDRGLSGHPTHYLYDELLHVPLLVRIPGRDSARINRIFSLGWLPELIADVLGLERGSFSLSSNQENHLAVEAGGEAPIIADSVSDAGHTIAARDAEYKYVDHFYPEPNDLRYDIVEDTCFHVCSDKGERHPLPGNRAPEPLQKAVAERRTPPGDLELVGYVTTDAARARLEQLGYKL